MPPTIFLIPCEQTAFTGKTYGDALLHLRQVKHELNICASRIEGIIEWGKSLKPAS